MTWNYRIIQFKDCCSLHEVHYDESGTITGRTENPRRVVGHEPSDLVADLEVMLADAKRLPPLPVGELPTACQ